MAYVRVYFGSEFKNVVEVKNSITIGRADDNDICISNQGVSNNHARITKVGEDYLLEDLGSTNGTYLNGQDIGSRRVKLKYGDQIAILKHSLRFVAWEASDQSTSEADITSDHFKATVMVDPNNLGRLLAEHKASGAARHGHWKARMVVSDKLGERQLECNKQLYTIGKASNCDIQYKGLIAPPVAARIERTSDGYLLTPEKPNEVVVNGRHFTKPGRLTNGDIIEIRGIAIRFQECAEEEATA